MGGPTPSLGTNAVFPDQIQDFRFNVWDPGIKTQSHCSRHVFRVQFPDTISTPAATVFPWTDSVQQNKIAHITSGNRGQRGRGIKCLYWNKGPSFLTNKQQDIESIKAANKPHILGLGEATFLHGHNVEDVQLQDYKLHMDSCVDNPDFKGYFVHIVDSLYN